MIINIFNSTVKTIVVDENAVTNTVNIPPTSATFCVENNNNIYLVGLNSKNQQVGGQTLVPSIVVRSYNKDGGDMHLFEGGDADEKSFESLFGFTLTKSGDILGVSSGIIRGVTPHGQFGWHTPAFIIKAPPDKKIESASNCSIEQPFKDTKITILGTTSDGQRNSKLMYSPFSNSANHSILRNAIYTEKGQHGMYDCNLKGSNRTTKVDYYIMILYHGIENISRNLT
jgi:hypothetical protein